MVAAMQGYQKTLHGPLIAGDIGLDENGRGFRTFRCGWK
ncbi:DUF4276 family protein [Pseudomonas putida]|nr:DUF4276 family protein [Pseudomonas sp. HLS-6]